MSHIVIPGQDEEHLAEAVRRLREARHIAALTGAGISVESGIPDFRSPGGVWTVFAPDEYATIEAFLQDPDKAWRMYRALGREIAGKEPNAAHRALARLEEAGRLEAIVTQNIDGLHQAAGSRNVLEIHGDGQRLQCIYCGWLGPMGDEHLVGEGAPACPRCRRPLKPNIVLFGEDVRDMAEIARAMARCDALLVIGTSAQVHPAAGLPEQVHRRGGLIYEFNLGPTDLTRGQVGYWGCGAVSSDWLFQGPATVTVPLVVDEVVGGE